ncbi:MAG: uroporphyrinogen decarboxylase [Chloroflexi bacterium]|nr:uroporphyrinogen decarboxylase [Chloroflexota bacterium]
MNKRERLHAAIEKKPVDRPPIGLWRHFPGDDLDAEKFARRVVEFQEKYDFDFVKVTPAASYVAELYGGELQDAGNREGTRTHTRRVINDWRDWNQVKPIEMNHPVFRREHEAMQRIRHALGKDVPILQTLFSPLSCARTLAGDRLVQDMREHPGELKHALHALGTTMERFGFNAVQAGADGLFLATQVASRDVLTPEESRAFGQAYNLALINELRGHVDFVMLHIHGENIYYEHLFKYPVQIVNWHDRKTPPSLRAGKALFDGAVAGGIDEWDVLQTTPDAIAAQIQDAIRQTDGTGLIVGAGCVIPIDTPPLNIKAAREAVEPV